MDSILEHVAVNESVVLVKKYCKSKARFINRMLKEYLNKKIQIRFTDRVKNEIRYLSVKY